MDDSAIANEEPKSSPEADAFSTPLGRLCQTENLFGTVSRNTSSGPRLLNALNVSGALPQTTGWAHGAEASDVLDFKRILLANEAAEPVERVICTPSDLNSLRNENAEYPTDVPNFAVKKVAGQKTDS